jgi:hypothetical protein
MAALVSRSRVCIVTNTWLSDPQIAAMVGTRQGALHRIGFAGMHPYAAARFTEWGGLRGVVLGTG